MEDYFRTKKGKEAWNRASKKAYLKFKDKWIARLRLREAVKIGKIEKPIMCQLYSPHPEIPCFGRIEAHHYKGYKGNNWKAVQWLCQKHHKIADKLLEFFE